MQCMNKYIQKSISSLFSLLKLNQPIKPNKTDIKKCQLFNVDIL